MLCYSVGVGIVECYAMLAAAQPNHAPHYSAVYSSPFVHSSSESGPSWPLVLTLSSSSCVLTPKKAPCIAAAAATTACEVEGDSMR